ncbi:MAG TPA: hypothetical protein VKU41_07880 [Polyangiaceae bacterium]|nr:hypothetical protein [Polyangiaceae bacterium]
MTLTGLIILLVIAGVCGSIGSGLAGHRNTGCIGSIALGFVGAFLGLWLARTLHLPELYVLHIGREAFPVAWSIVGAALFVGVLSFLTRPRGYF